MRWTSRYLLFLFCVPLIAFVSVCWGFDVSDVGSLSKIRKENVYYKLLYNEDYLKLAAILENELTLPVNAKNRLMPNADLQNFLADLYTFKLLDFGKATFYNDAVIKTIQNNEGLPKEWTKDQILEQYHARRIHLFKVTYDNEGLASYRGTHYFDRYVNADNIEVIKRTSISASPWYSLYVNMRKSFHNRDYLSCINAHEKLMREIREMESTLMNLEQEEAKKRELELDTKKDKIKEMAKATAIMSVGSVIVPPMLVFVPFMALALTEAMSNYSDVKQIHTRKTSLSFETKESKLLNHIISPIDQLDYLHDVAIAYENLGQTKEAIRNYESAIKIFENLRSTLESDRTKVSFYNDKTKIYHRLVNLLIKEKRLEEAFLYMDRYKNRSLVDLVASKLLVKGQNLLDTEVVREQQQIRALLDSSIISENQLRSIKLVHQPAVIQESSYQFRLRSLITVEGITAKEIDNFIGDKTVLQILYSEGTVIVCGYNRSYGFFCERKSIQESEFEEMIRQYIELLTDEKAGHSGKLLNMARSIHDVLFADIKNKIKGDLIIVPDKALNSIPFNTLYNGNQYLIEEHAITIMPALALARYLQARGPNNRILLIGDIEYNKVPKLPGTLREIQQIGDIYTKKQIIRGKDTKKEFLDSCGDYNLIHYAGHAVFDSEDPLKSGLVLTGNSEDQIMTGYEFLRLNMKANLVVLSACETGLTKVLNGAEIFGLTRSLFFAGTGSIVASLWKVDDEKTTETMILFYGYLRNGLHPDSALRKAQIEMLKRYKTPFYWAPFFVTGIC